MANFKFELDTAGVRELLKGPEMQGILKEMANNGASRYGGGAGTDIHVGRNRANARVYQRKGDSGNDLLKAFGRANNG